MRGFEGQEGSLSVTVDGLRCASCVWLVEEVLNRREGVSARLSHGSGRLDLAWTQGSPDQHLGVVQALGYRVRPLGSTPGPDRELLTRFGVASFLAANIMALHAALYLGWVDPMELGFERLFRWLALILATPTALWCAEPFHRRAWAGLRQGVLHMDLPVSLAVGLLWAHGVWATLSGAEAWLDSVAMLVALLLGGRLLEQRGRRGAWEAARSLAARAPARARLAHSLDEVDARSLLPGQQVEVASGEEIPADGQVVEGEGEVDRSLLTGESEAEAVHPGDPVVTGTRLVRGHLILAVEAAGEGTQLARMAEQLRLAPEAPDEGDRLAPWFTGATLGAAALAGLLHGSVEAVAAVLVVACPCALALAGPLSNAAGLGASARRGLMLTGGEVLERLAGVQRVVLDKTGTLTLGEPEVVEVDDEVLRLAAGLERASVHPIARALRAEALRRGLALPRPEGVVEQVGVGLSGVVEGHRVSLRSGGPGRVEVDWDGRSHGIVLRDRLREDSAQVVAALHGLGLSTLLLSGDRPEVAERIGAEAGVGQVLCGSPARKALEVGPADCFVGDGLNDALALDRAGVGLAMQAGAAPSLAAASGVVAGGSLRPVLAGVLAGRAARRARQTSRRRAVLYNVLAVGAALAGWVDPLVAALAMPLSSALVIAQALSVEREVARHLQ